VTAPLLTEAATVELVACAQDLARAVEDMRLHWAGATDVQRFELLWQPMCAAADVLRERLDLMTCQICHRPTDPASPECSACFMTSDVAYERSQDR
jgi:hypothetical protein